MKMWKIYALLTAAMITWGFNLPLLKFMILYIGPVTMTGFRILLAATSVFIILSALKLVRLPTKREWKFIILGALLNVVMHHYFLNMGLARTTGSNAGLILGTGPVLTAISVSLILRNYPSRIQWLGVLLGLGGVSSVVLAGGGLSNLALGDIFVFLAILAQVLSFLVISKAAGTLDPRLMTAYMMLIGSALLIIISLIQEPNEIYKFATAIGHLIYNYSVGQVGASKAAIFMNLNTLFSLIGSAIFLNETITNRHLIGFVLIIFGVILGSGAAEDLYKKHKTKSAA